MWGHGHFASVGYGPRMRGSGARRLSASFCQTPRDRKKSGIVLGVSIPYRPHSAYPGSAPPPPGAAKPRPSAAWFAVGGVLLLVAAIFFGVAVVRLVHTFGHTDAEFSGPGPLELSVTPDVQRALYVKGRFRCRAVDSSGTAVQFRTPTGTATYGEWHWRATFDTGTGRLEFRCHGPGSARISTVPDVGTVLSTLVLGILLPLVLGGLGFVVLLVTTVLWITRRPTLPPPAVPPAAAWPPNA